MELADLFPTKRDYELLSDEEKSVFKNIYETYGSALIKGGHPPNLLESLIRPYFHHVLKAKMGAYYFGHYHRAERSPYDFQQMGLSIFDAIIDPHKSTFFGKKRLKEISEALSRGENVIFLSNHQIEADPQVLMLMCRPDAPEILDKMIFVAGHRVTHDPLTIPFSLGLNLLCIYSKKYIEFPPEEKAHKLAHNQRTLGAMKERLVEGGSLIYVASSGGRDRPNAQGELLPAFFDPQSVELFYLISRQAKVPTHFYPLAMNTYDLLPPPDQVVTKLGEPRLFYYAPVHLSLGERLDMETMKGKLPFTADKKETRRLRAQLIWESVCNLYKEML